MASQATKTLATHEITLLLAEWADGNQRALDELTPLVYKELRKLAAGYLRKEVKNHTLQPTALVHEAYLRLVNQQIPTWQSRSHFFGVASRLMRQILVDHARRRQAGKRAALTLPLDEAVSFQKERDSDLVALDSALKELEKLEPRKCRAVELRYFGGLSMDEIALALKVSPVTVRRDLRMTEAWLRRKMQTAS
jgi:RNA polymerase sigma factor (TIGR02999 family)